MGKRSSLVSGDCGIKILPEDLVSRTFAIITVTRVGDIVFTNF